LTVEAIVSAVFNLCDNSLGKMFAPNREGVRLYRDILRACRFFNYPNQKGELWSDVLRANARKEFEQARYERDPEMIARLLMVGRDALNQTMEKYHAKAKSIADSIDKSRTS
jgi:Complex 1 protein (LYR family)